MIINDLYEAYLKRLSNIEVRKAREKVHEPQVSQPSKPVKSMVDYVRVLEDRIQRLEEAQAGYQNYANNRSDEEAKRRADEAARHTDHDSDDGPKLSGGEKTDEDKQPDLLLEIKFFHSAGEFDADGNYVDNLDKKGTYTCNTDPMYLVRALFSWADEAAPASKSKSPAHNPPNPDDIDILAFGIHSEPVAKFYEDKIGIPMESSHLLKTGKPFRPLIRNLHLLRGQLAKLEERFGSLDGQESPESKTTPIVQDSDRTPGSQTNDDLPFPTTPDESEAPGAYDTPKALVHFRMLIDFANKYMDKQIALFDGIRTGLEDKIAF